MGYIGDRALIKKWLEYSLCLGTQEQQDAGWADTLNLRYWGISKAAGNEFGMHIN